MCVVLSYQECRTNIILLNQTRFPTKLPSVTRQRSSELDDVHFGGEG